MQNLKKRNQKLSAKREELIVQVKPQIEDKERLLADRIYQQTEKIFEFLGRKSLPQWCKHELLDWLETNADILSRSPFADHIDMADLSDRILNSLHAFMCETNPEFARASAAFEELEQGEDDGEGEPNHKKQSDNHQQQDRSADIDDMFEELFAEFEAEFDDSLEPGDEEAFFDEFFDQWQGQFDQEQSDFDRQDQKQQQQQKELDKLLRASNINKIFRKIARLLHPDKEPDPDKKELRHQQMSELLKAREEKDIIALFDLYEQHIGQAPLEELGEDISSATRLLKNQAQELRQWHPAAEAKSHIEAYISELFAETSPQTLATKIRRHNAFLQQTIDSQELILSNMTSIKAIKPLLEDRRSSRMFTNMDQDYFY